ncbi:MAG: tetratricopeptide repeat protein [Candidatus Glassbacteria bacterium]
MTIKYLIMLLSMIILSCGGDSNPSSPFYEITAEGWLLFEDGNYQEAVGKFTEALGQNSSWADAHNGRGWSYLELRRLDEAETDLNNAVGLSLAAGYEQVRNEARTGLGSVLNSKGESIDASATLRAVIEDDASFTFSHRSSVDIIDVRLMLSTALLDLAVGESDPSVVDSYFDEIAQNLNSIDSENPISRDDPISWYVGEVRFDSFEEALLEKLEWLIELHSG